MSKCNDFAVGAGCGGELPLKIYPVTLKLCLLTYDIVIGSFQVYFGGYNLFRFTLHCFFAFRFLPKQYATQLILFRSLFILYKYIDLQMCFWK